MAINFYTRIHKHIDMDRVKELHEEKIKLKEIAKQTEESIREELTNLNSPEFSNWRWDLDEGMTTSALMTTTLPATGDVDLVTTDQTFETRHNGNNDSVSGGEVHLSGTENSIAGGEHTIYRRAIFQVDASKASTLKLTIQKGGGTSSWTDRDPAQSFNDNVSVNIYSDSDFMGDIFSDENMGSGTHLITLPKNYSDLVIQIEQFAKVSETGTLRITGASLQRRTPVSVMVSLDDPEASAFIRTDPIMTGLSAEERKKKLMDMLDAGDEYLLKYLGLIGSSARPSETIMPDSWEQAAWTGESPDPSEGKADVDQITDTIGLIAAGIGGVALGATGVASGLVASLGNFASKVKEGGKAWLNKGRYDKMPNENTATFDQLFKNDGLQRAYTDKAWKAYENSGFKPELMPKGWDLSKLIDPKYAGSGATPLMRQIVERPEIRNAFMAKIAELTAQSAVTVDSTNKSIQKMKEEVEPKNKKKSFKDITKKIPGYYDGKPAPLGFPMSPPPETINGYHPDLVTPEGQKKQAKRFNRLDPQSAKAMPPTGNPHIDKKVRAIAKKPK